MLRLLSFIAFVFAFGQVPESAPHALNKRRQLTDVTVTQTVGTQNQPRASFNYNPADHPLSLSGIRNASREIINGVERKVDYYYDPLNRLTREMVDPPDGDIEQVSYDSAPGYDDGGFDKVGNRRSRTAGLGLPAQSFTYNERDQISGPTFDKNGNTESANGVAYGYDVENRLLSANGITMVYDGDGNRVRKTVNGLTTHFLVDELNPTGYAQTLQEKVGNDPATAAISREYVWGHRLISQTASGSTHYYIHDGHGSTRALVHGSTVTDTYNYDAFGNELPQPQSAPPNLTENTYRYTGEQWDADLGLYYLRARYYHAGTGRFWSMDTFEGSQTDPLSLHKYLYCAADPVNNIDPSGLSVEFDAAKGQLVHEQFFVYCVTRGIPKFFDTPIGTAIPGLRGQEGSALRPDVLDVGGKRWFELKPITHRSSPDLAAATELQLGSYLAALGPAGISPGDAPTLVSKGTSIGTIIDPADRQVLEVFLEPSETIPGLVYYYFRKTRFDENESLEFVPLPVPYVSPNWNSAAKAVRLTAGTAAVAAGAVAAANLARTYMLSAQIAILRF